jgi:hypothetical protein
LILDIHVHIENQAQDKCFSDISVGRGRGKSEERGKRENMKKN